MKFEEQYLKHDEYKALGGTLDLVPFNLLEYDVRKTIDERTQNRLKKVSEVQQKVKLCIFKMIEIEEKYKPLELQNKTIVSTNTDGYSETYRKLEMSDIVTKDKELEHVMRTYLADVIVDGTPVLFLGVEKCW